VNRNRGRPDLRARWHARMSLNTIALLLPAAAAVGGCTTPGEATCRPDEKRRVSDTLYFGAAKPGGTVAPAEWSRFLDEWVTPRFPEGLTVWQASGQWRGADGRIVEEPSRVLNLIHAGATVDERKVEEISGEYKRRFQQEAVLRTRGAVCVSF
jgi:hypothetical protein